MKYYSTRDTKKLYPLSSAQAIKQGIAPDKGLYMPEEIPTLSHDEICELVGMSYTERAAHILGKFLTDYTYEELYSCANKAYSYVKFPGGAAPLTALGDTHRILELWHGPTCAFKDMALQIMPHLVSLALDKTGEKNDAFILVATSGDTGKAALEGYADAPRVKIMVFYPQDGVSDMQKLQMTSQTGENVFVCAINGNFDDAQTGVKQIFADDTVANKLSEHGIFLSSANSINWGRLAPQIVYYVSAYCDLLKEEDIALGDKINICVPTGNFGNIFAAFIAKKMGLPVNKLICASNKNNILTDFIKTGTYDRNREFFTTMSPSMDILISSNLERLLYYIAGPEKTKEYMEKLSSDGCYTVDKDVLDIINEHFCADFSTETQCAQTIKDTFDEYSYLVDTHTAVALCAAEKFKQDNQTNCSRIVTASTASPYKFAADVLASLTGNDCQSSFEVIYKLNELTDTEIPLPLKKLENAEVRFKGCTDKTKQAMLSAAYKFLGIE